MTKVLVYDEKLMMIDAVEVDLITINVNNIAVFNAKPRDEYDVDMIFGVSKYNVGETDKGVKYLDVYYCDNVND